MRLASYLFCAALLASSVQACRPRNASALRAAEAGSGDISTGAAKPLGTCVALRGNGPAILGHFASLAQISEHYGTIDGMAGGSSASLTQFLYDSMRLNLDVSDCPTCGDPAVVGARLALLLKSVQGYFEALAEAPEVVAIQGIASVFTSDRLKKVEQDIADFPRSAQDAALVASALALLKLVGGANDSDAKVPAIEKKLSEFFQYAPMLTASETAALRQNFMSIVESGELRIINAKAWLEVFAASRDPAFHAREFMTAIARFGQFAPDTQLVLHRPGLLSFSELTVSYNRIGSLYAGYDGVARGELRGFMDACAAATRGLPWRDAQDVNAGGQTCGRRFRDLAVSFRQRYKVAEAAGTAKSRLDEKVGANVAAFPVTAVLKGEGRAAFLEARVAYNSGHPSPPFNVETLGTYRDSVGIGYWGRADLLAKVGANGRGYEDFKTILFQSLGSKTWREALSLSPAEPGLANLQPLGDELTSMAGWPDLSPVLVLKNAGCDKVIYVTSRWSAPVSDGFDHKMAKLLGASEITLDGIYSDAFRRSLREADGVWCTDWNSHFDTATTDPDALVADAYAADFLVKDLSTFKDLRAVDGNEYKKVAKGTQIAQCSDSNTPSVEPPPDIPAPGSE